MPYEVPRLLKPNPVDPFDLASGQKPRLITRTPHPRAETQNEPMIFDRINDLVARLNADPRRHKRRVL